jgi:acyl-CoA thioesterase-1
VFFMLLVAAAAYAAPQKSILVVGDSLSAAYGIASSRGWVALLAERLRRERPDYSVVNASVSGDTTAGGRARMQSALARHKPAVVVIELGGNDGLRGLPVAQLKENLSAMARAARAAGARVLLVGMRIPPNYGPDYADAFAAAFRDVAKAHKAAFVPFFLEGFAEDPAMFQDDRIHPTEAAQPLMLERVWKELRPIL